VVIKYLFKSNMIYKQLIVFAFVRLFKCTIPLLPKLINTIRSKREPNCFNKSISSM